MSKTQSQIATANRVALKSSLTTEQRLVLGLVGGKENKAVAAGAAGEVITKLLRGDMMQKPEAATTLLRAWMKLEHARFDVLFQDFRGTLADVAGLTSLADPFAAVLLALDATADQRRALGIDENDVVKSRRVGPAREACLKASKSESASKLVHHVNTCLTMISMETDRAATKLAKPAEKAAMA